MEEKSNDKILKLLEEKILLKKEVFEKTQLIFGEIKKKLGDLADNLKASVKEISKDSLTVYTEAGEFEAHFTLADEVLVFVMHSNIFTFEHSHEIWKNKYVQEDPSRAYCGKIFVYNFLSESFKYNRSEDVGYLIARIFINKEGHFFMEGKKQLGYLYSDFPTTVVDSDVIFNIIESAILFSIDFDPFTRPFESIPVISVKDVLEARVQSRIITGKRLGFQFSAEGKEIK